MNTTGKKGNIRLHNKTKCHLRDGHYFCGQIQVKRLCSQSLSKIWSYPVQIVCCPVQFLMMMHECNQKNSVFCYRPIVSKTQCREIPKITRPNFYYTFVILVIHQISFSSLTIHIFQEDNLKTRVQNAEYTCLKRPKMVIPFGWSLCCMRNESCAYFPCIGLIEFVVGSFSGPKPKDNHWRRALYPGGRFIIKGRGWKMCQLVGINCSNKMEYG